ncbi:Uncharacterized protein ToN1_41550 [Aromatoleum petrolei]|nr:Uncharacterized protein ToN1_41550 [Aromatoleum petrolei]
MGSTGPGEEWFAGPGRSVAALVDADLQGRTLKDAGVKQNQ